MSEYGENNLIQKQITIEELKNQGWDAINAMYEHVNINRTGELGRASQSEIILQKFLFPKLKQFNPNITDAQCNKILYILNNYNINNEKSLSINQEKLNLIQNGVVLSVLNNGKTENVTFKLIDFKNPENNSFIAVQEMTIKTIYNRRPDIIGYINGIPLVFFELKRDDISVFEAYNKNLRDYRDTIPQLFHCNAFCVLSNANQALVGTHFAPFEFFTEWKRLDESEHEGVLGIERLVNGLCNKINIIDIIENFIIFDNSQGQLIKIVARNHQFLGTNLAIENFINRKNLDHKLGLFWHTQGSGKSYTMVFFVKKILRKFGENFTFMILTDREELNTQIFNTFVGTNVISNSSASTVIAKSSNHLIEIIKSGQQFIFSLIQKFNNPNQEAIHISHDIIVLSDEAHRTNNGYFARIMSQTIPDAYKLGFTGTPLMRDDEISRKTFGSYVSKYDFGRAILDHATVPLYYLNRSHLLGLNNPKMNQQLIDLIDNDTNEDLSEKAKEKITKQLVSQVLMLQAESRLKIIAKDFVEHYTSNWLYGKAMVVSCSKLASVRMYLYVSDIWNKEIEKLESKINNTKNFESEQDRAELNRKLIWMKSTKMEVLISTSQNEIDYFNKYNIDIKSIRKQQINRSLDKEYKDTNNPFRIVFVCAMWLTGFDVKSLTNLYIDKPLKSHNLMQTIARANRVSKGKENGVIIDYIGIVAQLKDALKEFGGSVKGDGEEEDNGGSGGNGGGDITYDFEKLKQQTQILINEIYESFIQVFNFNIDDIINAEPKQRVILFNQASAYILRNDEFRKKFNLLFAKAKHAVEVLFANSIDISDLMPRYNVISAIHSRSIVKAERLDIEDILKKALDIVSDSVITNNENQGLEAIDISSIDFSKLSINKKSKEKVDEIFIEKLRQNIELAIKKLQEQNSNQTRIDFEERYKKIIKDYNNNQDKAYIETIFNELMNLTRDMSKEQKRKTAEGFNSEVQLAIFDLLTNKKLKKEEIELLKSVSKKVVNEVTKSIKENLNWRESQQKQSVIFNTIYYTLREELEPSENINIEYINTESTYIFNYFYTHVNYA